LPDLEDRLGYRFRDPALLAEALTHPSALTEGRSPGPDYQRLEFLGDAVLQLGVSLLLFRARPDAREGTLSFLRQEMVRRETVAEMARRAGLRGELIAGTSVKSAGEIGEGSVLADAMEAVLGAVWLDGGPEAAFGILERLAGEIPEENGGLKGFKSELQEYLQGEFDGEVPEYLVVDEGAAGDEDRFLARAFHRGRLLGEGRGRSKKRAEESAARAALKELGASPISSPENPKK